MPACFWLYNRREPKSFRRLILKWEGRAREWPHRRISGRREIDESHVLDAIAETIRTKADKLDSHIHISVIGVPHSDREVCLVHFTRYTSGVVDGGTTPVFDTGMLPPFRG